MEMTEKSIQDALQRWLDGKGHYGIVPNICLFQPWESDLVSVTRNDFINEYEIKISHSDYSRDFSDKKSKHDLYAHPYEKPSGCTYPNYFWFVVPDQMIDLSQVPEYAGLIYIRRIVRTSRLPGIAVDTESLQPEICKRAPRLHNSRLLENHRRQIVAGLGFRYWSARATVEYQRSIIENHTRR